MTRSEPAYRCAAASRLRAEPAAGTASTVRAFLLIEHAGPWGSDALRDARLPDGLGDAVTRAATAARVRPLLIRRPVRSSPSARMRVFAAFTEPGRVFLETTVLTDPHGLLGLDLKSLGAGRSPGLTPCEDTLLCVCTHGRHDACCAERGRPVARALGAVHPGATWEISHIGGDRFAGNMLVLPDGLYYGQLDPASALGVVERHTAGDLDLNHLRGRSAYPMAVQFAEIALRRELGETRDDALWLVSQETHGQMTRAIFAVGEDHWQVHVHSSDGAEDLQLTCRATRTNPVPEHAVQVLTRVR